MPGVPTEYSATGLNLGAWTATQRALHTKGTLDPARASRLGSLPGWAWNQLDDQWEQAFACLLSFVEREGHARVPQGWVEGGYRLGRWTAIQRRRFIRGQFDPERLARLEEAPGWSWTPRDERWENGYRHLLDYVAKHGTADVPLDHTENGYRLGRWARKQRHAKRAPGDERWGLLASLPGWTWEPYAEQWDRAFGLLVAYAGREGHCRVPQALAQDGVRLGGWVSSQRIEYKKGRLSKERADRLEGVTGWTWNQTFDRWEQAYNLLVEFVEKRGTADVPADWVAGHFKLGQWARTQRVFFSKGRLDVSRAQRLAGLPGWRWDPFRERWDDGFDCLREFVAREGHCLVRRDHVENDFRLGQWVSNQRAFFKRGDLDPARAHRLEGVKGWTWHPPRGPVPRHRAAV